jgi:hypothetical protein
MISISKFGHNDYGRFGNQLFQYSLAKILSTHNNCNFYLNPSNHFVNFFDKKYLTYRPIIKDLKTKSYIESDAYGFDNTIYSKINIDIIGFFQNLQYYKNNLDILKSEFVPNPIKLSNTLDYLKSKTKYNLNLDEAICLHIRRTDYTNLQNKYGFLNIQYYLHIIKNYIDKYQHIFIISDDIYRIKSELQGVLLDANVYLVDSLDIYYDFYTMYLSRINLIANSTFSWWSAMLSSLNGAKTIFIPYPWLNYTNSKYSTLSPSDINLYPESWNKINSNTIRWNELFV